MAKTKFKLTKSVKAEIRIAIEGLPPMPSNVARPVNALGTMLFKMGYETVNGGNPIDPNQNYVIMMPYPVDHYKQAQEEYRLGGVLALTAYVVKALAYGKSIDHEGSKAAIENAVSNN